MIPDPDGISRRPITGPFSSALIQPMHLAIGIDRFSEEAFDNLPNAFVTMRIGLLHFPQFPGKVLGGSIQMVVVQCFSLRCPKKE